MSYLSDLSEISYSLKKQYVVTRPFRLVKSRLQDAPANAGMLFVYPTTILYHPYQLFFDTEQEKRPSISYKNVPKISSQMASESPHNASKK